PSTLRRIDDQRAFLERHSGQPPRQDVNVFAIENIRAEINVPTLEVVVYDHWHAGEGQSWLGNIIARVSPNQTGELLELGGGGVGTAHPTISAGLVSRLDHQLIKMVQNIAEFLLLPAAVGGHVGKHAILVQIIFDNLRDVVV